MRFSPLGSDAGLQPSPPLDFGRSHGCPGYDFARVGDAPLAHLGAPFGHVDQFVVAKEMPNCGCPNSDNPSRHCDPPPGRDDGTYGALSGCHQITAVKSAAARVDGLISCAVVTTVPVLLRAGQSVGGRKRAGICESAQEPGNLGAHFVNELAHLGGQGVAEVRVRCPNAETNGCACPQKSEGEEGGDVERLRRVASASHVCRALLMSRRVVPLERKLAR